MRLLSTSLLLLILAFAASCSQGNYAQVEPDDLYFTRSDRKAANVQYMASASTNNSYDYNDRDVSNYTNQHSPTITSSTLGSPTIQSTTETFYDANQNPDYVSVQADPAVETSSDYYVEDYGLPIIETVVPQTTVNNFYGANPYSNISPWSSSFNMSFGYGYGSFYDPYYNQFYNPYYNQYNTSWGYYPYRRSYRDYNNPWNNYYYGGGYPNYGTGSYCYNPITYNNYNGNSGYSGNTNYNNTDNGSYRDGTKIKTSPRRSRSTVSDYTNTQYVSRKRTNYDNEGNSGGRISDNTNNDRQIGKTVPTERNISPYKNGGTDKDRRAKYGDMNSSSPTVQKNNNVRRKINTTLQRQWSRSNSGVISSGNRSNSNNGSTKRYSGASRGGQNSGYTRPKSNSSYTPSRNKSSSRSSYSPSRSSSTQRSTPSRSSGSKSTTSRKRN